MRMRRKRNLEPRMQACGDLLLVRGRPCLNLKEAAENYRALLDLSAVFGEGKPVKLEVGCGNGGFLLELAAREPEVGFLAVEVCTNVILTAMERMRAKGLPNVRFLNIPAETLPCYIPSGSISEIYLNFSTPLPEKGCERQRLTSPRFLAIYRDILKENGRIYQKTDSAFFFDYSLEQFAANGFRVIACTRDLHHSAYAEGNIVTEYEANFLSQGKPICMAIAEKNLDFSCGMTVGRCEACKVLEG